ncbi:MAG: type II secretion system minor pseudopilin GspI [Methylococcaceae bacterium]|jgi:general secretion pathway protein I
MINSRPGGLSQGFTLLEVLIALALLAIVMAGTIKITAENINNLRYLENKTVAASVANNHAVLLQLDKERPEHLEGFDDMLGRRWYWRAKRGSSNIAGVWHYQIDVFLVGEKNPYASLTSTVLKTK